MQYCYNIDAFAILFCYFHAAACFAVLSPLCYGSLGNLLVALGGNSQFHQYYYCNCFIKSCLTLFFPLDMYEVAVLLKLFPVRRCDVFPLVLP